jgi:hypothetical protein
LVRCSPCRQIHLAAFLRHAQGGRKKRITDCARLFSVW